MNALASEQSFVLASIKILETRKTNGEINVSSAFLILSSKEETSVDKYLGLYEVSPS